MNTQTESKPVDAISEAITKIENPMQERHCGEVTESAEVTAEAAFTARVLEVRAEQGRSIREEAGPIFVP
jgi:hypothetical protein